MQIYFFFKTFSTFQFSSIELINDMPHSTSNRVNALNRIPFVHECEIHGLVLPRENYLKVEKYLDLKYLKDKNLKELKRQGRKAFCKL